MPTATAEAPQVASPQPAARLPAMRRGECGIVVGVDGGLSMAVRSRLADLGFVPGTAVQCLRRAPLGSPVVYSIGESEVCLRADLAGGVLVSRGA
jgi:ferrous iron transport protein A